MRFITNIQKLISSLLSLGILAFFAVLFFANRLYIPGGICVLLAVVFLLILMESSSVIHMDSQNIERRTWLIRRRVLPWSQIREVGIAGTNVLHSGRGKGGGPIYIYFSPEKMTEEERFSMCLHWPPKNIIYMKYTPERIHCVQKFWSEDPVLYNTSTLKF